MKTTYIITFGILVLNLLCGCINSHGDPTSANACVDPSTVAIAPANENPDVILRYDGDEGTIQLNAPAKGALKGTMYGLEFFGECAKGISGDGAAFFLPLCFLAVPTGTVIGGLTGIFSGDTEETLTDGDPPPNIRNEIVATGINSQLASLLLERFEKNTNTSFVLGELDQKNYYFPKFNSELDVAMLVNLYSTDFIGDDDLWGDFQLIVRARSDLFVLDDGQSRVYSHELFKCKGEKQTLIQWSADDSSELHQSLNKCLDNLANQIEDHYMENRDSWCD